MTQTAMETLIADAQNSPKLRPEMVSNLQSLIADSMHDWLHALLSGNERLVAKHTLGLMQETSRPSALALQSAHYLSTTLNLFDPFAKIPFNRCGNKREAVYAIVISVWAIYDPTRSANSAGPLSGKVVEALKLFFEEGRGNG